MAAEVTTVADLLSVSSIPFGLAAGESVMNVGP